MKPKKSPMLLETAQNRAEEFYRRTKGFYERFRVVGSIRRQKEKVNDIDLLVIYRPGGPVDLLRWAKEQKDGTRVERAGAKLITLNWRGTQVDVYAASPETWGTLLLIKTGSAEHNRKLCALAKSSGWQLKANGDGLFGRSGKRLAGDTEESFFKALGLPFKPPEERD